LGSWPIAQAIGAFPTGIKWGDGEENAQAKSIYVENFELCDIGVWGGMCVWAAEFADQREL
jgi:hypothetical protein